MSRKGATRSYTTRAERRFVMQAIDIQAGLWAIYRHLEERLLAYELARVTEAKRANA